MHPMLLAAMAAPAGIELVTLSGGSVTHMSGGTNAIAGIRLNLDGTIDKREGVSYSQISATTDWVRPVTSYTGTYHVKWEPVLGTCDVTPFSSGSWQAMASGPYEWRETESSNGIDTCTITIYISDDGGSTTLAQANYMLEADDTP